MSRCKAPEILRNKAYLEGTSLTKDEGNAADGRFSSACYALQIAPVLADVTTAAYRASQPLLIFGSGFRQPARR